MPTFSPLASNHEKSMDPEMKNLWEDYEEEDRKARRRLQCGPKICLFRIFNIPTAQYVKMLVLLLLAATHLFYFGGDLAAARSYLNLHPTNEEGFHFESNSDALRNFLLVNRVYSYLLSYQLNEWFAVGCMCASLAVTAIIFMDIFYKRPIGDKMLKMIYVIDAVVLGVIGATLFYRWYLTKCWSPLILDAMVASESLIKTQNITNFMPCSYTETPQCPELHPISSIPIAFIEYLIILVVLTLAYILLAYLIQWCIRHYFPPNRRQNIATVDQPKLLIDEKFVAPAHNILQ